MTDTLDILRTRGLVLATHNRGKIAEFARWLAPLGVEVTSAGDHDVPAPEETATDFLGNARLKAEAVHRATGLPALADDSGLAVDDLGGAPGLHSARWAPGGDYAAAFARIAKGLGGTAAMDGAPAAFVCVLVLLTEGGETTGEGRCPGHLVSAPRGRGGFGYDPIFVPEGERDTFGEMPADVKARHSHRARALTDLAGRAGLPTP